MNEIAHFGKSLYYAFRGCVRKSNSGIKWLNERELVFPNILLVLKPLHVLKPLILHVLMACFETGKGRNLLYLVKVYNMLSVFVLKSNSGIKWMN